MASAMETSEGDALTAEERVAWLRARGVEIDLVHDKSGPNRPPRRGEAADGAQERNQDPRKYFAYVCIPVSGEVHVERCLRDYREGDSLKDWLGPRFRDDAAISSEAVERETRAQFDRMVTSSNGRLVAPTTSTIREVARDSGAEAYPLAQPTEENGYEAVRLYVDEVGALRERARNPRAERFAFETAGLGGLRIHGDAYVGRTMQTPHGIENLDLTLDDLLPTSPWAVAARRSHAVQLASMPSTDLKKGSTAAYDWSQTMDDLEVSVKLPADVDKGQVRVDYGKAGSSLFIFVAGAPLVSIPRLFARISPDQSSWTIDDDRLVLSLEKTQVRDWAALELAG